MRSSWAAPRGVDWPDSIGLNKSECHALEIEEQEALLYEPCVARGPGGASYDLGGRRAALMQPLATLCPVSAPRQNQLT